MLFDKHKKFVKLIDFGFANFCKAPGDEDGNEGEEIRFDELKGTPYYIAPEVIHGDYDKRADLWSLGVVTYYLLSGRQPFIASNQEDLYKKILQTDYNFEGPVWQGISRQAKHFIEALIEPNVDKRMTCVQALEHPWIKD